LFIAGGAFVGLKDILKNRKKGSTIGFGAEINASEEAKLNEVTPDDLTRFGMIPEFIGRFTTTVTLEDLNKEQLLRVLTEIKNNYISQYQYLFGLDSVNLVFNDESLDQIAENCLKLKTGARGLHTEIEKVLMPHMYNLRNYSKNDVKEINITRELVLEPKALL
jgi:ATP-dependent Clp protease ATP-binding subunit ClpX